MPQTCSSLGGYLSRRQKCLRHVVHRAVTCVRHKREIRFESVFQFFADPVFDLTGFEIKIYADQHDALVVTPDLAA